MPDSTENACPFVECQGRPAHPDDRVPGQTIIYHCMWCLAFVIRPVSDECACGGGWYPVQFRAGDGIPFWASEQAESKLTADRNKADS